jgi:hypothetical protein
MFGHACKVQWDRVPDWHACAHGQVWVAACAVLLACACHVHVIYLSAAVNALAEFVVSSCVFVSV